MIKSVMVYMMKNFDMVLHILSVMTKHFILKLLFLYLKEKDAV